MWKWIAIIAGAIVALYLVVAGIKYVCFGTSDEGDIVPPGDYSVTVE